LVHEQEKKKEPEYTLLQNWMFFVEDWRLYSYNSKVLSGSQENPVLVMIPVSQ
jgi:hypothetical protein